MHLYSFEGRGTLGRLKGKTVVADTSYFIDVAIPPDNSNTPAIRFHPKARSAGVKFVSTVTVRHELMEYLRYGYLLEALSSFRAACPVLETRWRAIPHSRRTDNRGRPLTNVEDFIDENPHAIHQNCIQENEATDLAAYMPDDIWAVCQEYETGLGITYVSPQERPTWDSLGDIIKQTTMKVTDCMIANYAIATGACAIVTLDGEFAAVCDKIDVYMPRSKARQFAIYDESKD